MERVEIYTEFITLGQFLKITNTVESGGEVKFFLSENKVYVNGQLDIRRGRKLYKGDQISLNNKKYIIC